MTRSLLESPDPLDRLQQSLPEYPSRDGTYLSAPSPHLSPLADPSLTGGLPLAEDQLREVQRQAGLALGMAGSVSRLPDAMRLVYPAQADLSRFARPGMLYHATDMSNLESIAESGLLPRLMRPAAFEAKFNTTRYYDRPRLYAMDDLARIPDFVAANQNPGPFAVLGFDRASAPRWMSGAERDLYTTRQIPADLLQVLGQEGWLPLRAR